MAHGGIQPWFSSARLSSTTCGEKAEGKTRCCELAEAWINPLGQEKCCSWISSYTCWVLHVQEPPGTAQGWVTQVAQDKGLKSPVPWGGWESFLCSSFSFSTPFFCLLPGEIIQTQATWKDLVAVQCQELSMPHLPALHGVAGAPVHSVRLFPAIFWLEKQIITQDKLSRIQNSTKGDTRYSLAIPS